MPNVKTLPTGGTIVKLNKTPLLGGWPIGWPPSNGSSARWGCWTTASGVAKAQTARTSLTFHVCEVPDGRQ